MAYINAITYNKDAGPLPNGCSDRPFHEWDTNIYQLKLSGATETAKSIKISLNHTSYFDFLLENFKEIFQFENFSWTNVEKLCLDIQDFDNFIKPGLKSKDKHEQLISQVVEALSKYVPNVEVLDIINMSPIEAPALLGKRIAELYAGKLREFSSNSRLVSENLVFSDRLESLKLDLDGSGYAVNLKQSVASLKELTLDHPPANFDWRIFTGGEEFSELEFPKLHSLAIFAVVHCMPSCPYGNSPSKNEAEDDSFMLTNNVENALVGKIVLPKLTSLKIGTDRIQHIQRIFCDGIYKWPNVKSITIQHISLFINFFKDNDVSRQNAEVLYQAITKSMPNISKVIYKYMYPTGFNDYCRLISRLVEFYAHQIEYLLASNPLNIEKPICLDRIEELELTADLKTPNFKVNTKSLRLLKLRDALRSFKWSNIIPVDKSKVIDLPNLETLDICFDKDATSWRTEFDKLVEIQDNVKKHYLVDCPKLQSLDIVNCSYISLLNIIGFGSCKWVNVKRLSIKIGYYDHENVLMYGDNRQTFEELLESFGQRIFEIMPGITELTCEDESGSGKYNHMFAKLAQLYAPRLKKISIDMPISLNNLDNAGNLNELSLNLKNTEHSDPQIDGKNLIRVSVENTYAPFSWNWFSIDGDNDTVNLKKLTKVSVSYSIDYRDTDPSDAGAASDKVILSMDKLDTFEINAIRASKLVEYPEHELHFNSCNKITFSGNVSALPICGSSSARLDLVQVEKITADSSSEDHFYRFANSWFGQNEISKMSTLSLTNLDFILDPQQINWINLKELVVDSLVGYQALLEIIPRLKQIIKLRLNKVSVKSLPALCNVHPVEKLSDSIKSIELVGISNCSKNVARQAIEYVVCALPTLKHILVDYGIGFNSTGFINSFSNAYPHINNVKYM